MVAICTSSSREDVIIAHKARYSCVVRQIGGVRISCRQQLAIRYVSETEIFNASFWLGFGAVGKKLQ